MKKTMSSLFVLAISSLSLLAHVGGCSHPAEEQYATLVECVVDHTEVEMLTEQQAITVCLLSHLDALNLNFTTAAECVAYVTANGGYPNTRQAACDAYIQEKMP